MFVWLFSLFLPFVELLLILMKFLAYLVCYFLYPFSFLFPRSKKKWAFGSFRGAFNDNAKYLFIYTSEQKPEIHSAWLSIKRSTVREIRDKGLCAYWILNPKGLWFALTSKYWFFNAYSSDIMFCLSGGATLVNLWHGLPMKRIEFGITSGPLADRFVKKTLKERYYHPETFQRPDYLLSASTFFTEIFAHSFRVSTDRCLTIGYPRNAVLTCSEKERLRFVEKYEPKQTALLIEQLKESGYKKVFVYLPTWRDSQKELFVQSFDLKKMNSLLGEDHALLLLKPHVNMSVDEKLVDGLSNIMLLPSKMDVYPVLPYTDVLITDYSSILYDYVLMENKGVILYLYDYQDYTKERNFTMPFDELVIGERADTFEQLLDLMHAGGEWLDPVERHAFVKRCWGDRSQSASADIAGFFCP